MLDSERRDSATAAAARWQADAVIAGGNIPPADAEQLREWGVREVVGPGSNPDDAIELVKDLRGAA